MREQGRLAALRTFGLIKSANEPTLTGSAASSTEPSVASRMGNWAKGMLIGDPGRVMNELQAGTIHKPGGALHESFMPGNAIGAALNYGLPAYQLYDMMKTPGAATGSNVGQFLGSTLGGFVGSPLGFLGNMGASAALGSLGKHLGGVFDQHRQSSPSPAPKDDRPPLSQEMSRITGQPT